MDYWRIEAQAGDILSISVDTPDSELYPAVSLLNAGGSSLISNVSDGPGYDSFISHYVIRAAAVITCGWASEVELDGQLSGTGGVGAGHSAGDGCGLQQ